MMPEVTPPVRKASGVPGTAEEVALFARDLPGGRVLILHSRSCNWMLTLSRQGSLVWERGWEFAMLSIAFSALLGWTETQEPTGWIRAISMRDGRRILRRRPRGEASWFECLGEWEAIRCLRCGHVDLSPSHWETWECVRCGGDPDRAVAAQPEGEHAQDH